MAEKESATSSNPNPHPSSNPHPIPRPTPTLTPTPHQEIIKNSGLAITSADDLDDAAQKAVAALK